MSISFRNIFAFIIVLLFSGVIEAQPQKGEFLNVSIGYGQSAPYDDVDIGGSGFYAQAEYVIGLTKWLGIRPYAGLIFTSPNKSDNQALLEYKVTSNAFLIGGKARFLIPIPWVAPYFEAGVGASIGKFVTHTPITYKEEKGVLTHIPVTIGLALGRQNNIEIAATYYYNPSVEQFSGAIAFGLTFPLN